MLLIGIVPWTSPRLVDRRFHSWSDHPVNTFVSSFRHVFSVWIKFDELLALCSCNSLQLFLSSSSTFPNNVAMHHINWQSEWVWLQNGYFSKKVSMVLAIMRPVLTEKFLRRFNVGIQHEKLRGWVEQDSRLRAQFIAISFNWLQYCMSCSTPQRTHANIKSHHAWKNITDA